MTDRVVAREAAAELPWPEPPRASPWNRVRFDHYANPHVAQFVAGLLECVGVPAIIEADGAMPGLRPATVWVPDFLVHRARWVLAWPAPDEGELVFLATGQLDSCVPGGAGPPAGVI